MHNSQTEISQVLYKVMENYLCSRTYVLLITPVILLAMLIFSFMCFVKSICVSKVTPRSFSEVLSDKKCLSLQCVLLSNLETFFKV